LWYIDLSQPVTALTHLLSDDELARMRAQHTAAGAAAFAHARGAMRAILARYLQTNAAGLAFRYGKLGRPALADSPQPIDFNLSHSSGLALLVVTGGLAVGVDLEAIRERRGYLKIARRLFSESVYQQLAETPAETRFSAFLQRWTRLEASTKALGGGVFSGNLAALPCQNFTPCSGWMAAVSMTAPLPDRNEWRLYRFD